MRFDLLPEGVPHHPEAHRGASTRKTKPLWYSGCARQARLHQSSHLTARASGSIAAATSSETAAAIVASRLCGSAAPVVELIRCPIDPSLHGRTAPRRCSDLRTQAAPKRQAALLKNPLVWLALRFERSSLGRKIAWRVGPWSNLPTVSSCEAC